MKASALKTSPTTLVVSYNCNPMDAVVRKMDLFNDGKFRRDRGRRRKTLEEIIKRNPSLNGFIEDMVFDRGIEHNGII